MRSTGDEVISQKTRRKSPVSVQPLPLQPIPSAQPIHTAQPLPQVSHQGTFAFGSSLSDLNYGGPNPYSSFPPTLMPQYPPPIDFVPHPHLEIPFRNLIRAAQEYAIACQHNEHLQKAVSEVGSLTQQLPGNNPLGSTAAVATSSYTSHYSPTPSRQRRSTPAITGPPILDEDDECIPSIDELHQNPPLSPVTAAQTEAKHDRDTVTDG